MDEHVAGAATNDGAAQERTATGPDPQRNSEVFLDLLSILEAVPPPPRPRPLEFPAEVWR